MSPKRVSLRAAQTPRLTPRQWILEHCGEEGLRVFTALPQSVREGKTDGDLANELGMKINIVRRELYRLQDHHLARVFEHRGDDPYATITYTYSANPIETLQLAKPDVESE
ncbi:MAG: hypothetical protein HY558_01305 [Euryarchaeota archaeon]|nr:hypothetical protein [Euryarchaeota archaeon]